MKKNILYLAVLFVGLAFFTACSSDGDDVEAPVAPTLHSTPANEALTLGFSSSTAPFKEIIFSETGKAIITRNVLTPSSSKRRASDSSEKYVVGTYKTSNNTYVVSVDGSEYCTVEVTGKTGTKTSVKVSLKSGSDIEATEYEGEASIGQKVAADEITSNLCREWTVATTRLRHKDGVTAVKQFETSAEAASLNAILAYAKTVASIDESFDEDMVITSIEFTADGNFCIFFKDGEHYIGKWSWKDTSKGYLHYNWNDADMGNQFENGEAVFDVRQYKKVSYYTLTLGADINSGGKKYTVELSFYLNEK